MRKSLALIFSAGLLAALSACAPTGSGLAIGDCTPRSASGPSSQTVTAAGAPGAATVSFGSPIHAPQTERTVIDAGSGPAARPGAVVVGYAAIASGTGQGQPQQAKFLATLDDTATVPGLIDSLVCARAGDRIAAVVPAARMTMDTATAPTDNSADVILFDIDSVYPGSATGAVQPAEAGFPSVVTADNGRPGVTIPSGEVPADLRVSTLKKGDGATVKEGDILIAQSLGIVWSDRSVFESTWAKGQATQLIVADSTTTQNGVVPGLVTALAGQTVGSQVLVVVPPDQGFGTTGADAVPPGATLVYVIDILGISPVL